MPAAPAKASGGSTWASAVLTRLGITPNTSNVFALREWSISEGNNTGGHAHYNWLNSVGQAPGSTNYNSVGVQNYVSYTQGVAQTASLLKGSGWSGVLRALSLQPSPTTGGKLKTRLSTGAVITRNLTARIWTAIHNSPAAGSPAATRKLQTGKYPVTLWTFNNGTGATVGGTWATSTVLKGTPNPTTTPNRCVWKLGPGLCILNAHQARALKGGLLVTAGGVVAFVGLAILAAYGFEKQGPLGQVTKAARAVGIGGPGAQTGAQRRAQAEADAQERRATPSQLAGTPTPAGERLKAAEEPRRPGRDRPGRDEPFTEADTTPRLRQRTAERRPHSRQHRTRNRAR